MCSNMCDIYYITFIFIFIYSSMVILRADGSHDNKQSILPRNVHQYQMSCTCVDGLLGAGD